MEVLDLSEETQAGIAADRIMSDIRTGILPPRYKLRVAELKTRYGIGASPLREALSLVTSLGYANSESHRGYRVADMSPEDLADITRAREVIETGMLRESMLAHSDDWAIGIIGEMERLRRVAAKSSSDGIDTSHALKAAHKQLHLALTAGSSSKRLGKMQDLLFDQAGRYREIMIAEVRSPKHFVETHEALVQTILDGDVDKACKALGEHLHRTFREVYVQVAGDTEVTEQSPSGVCTL